MERRDGKETRPQLAPIAEGPFQLKEVDSASKTVVMGREELSTENLLRSHVTVPPSRDPAKGLIEATRYQTDEEIGTYDSTDDQENINQLVKPLPTLEPREEPTEETETAEERNEKDQQALENEYETETEKENDREDLVMDKIFDHWTNRSLNQKYAEHGKIFYRIRCYGFEPQDDTWEPISHL